MGWFFMEEDEERVNNVDLKDGCIDTRVEPLKGLRGVAELGWLRVDVGVEDGDWRVEWRMDPEKLGEGFVEEIANIRLMVLILA